MIWSRARPGPTSQATGFMIHWDEDQRTVKLDRRRAWLTAKRPLHYFSPMMRAVKGSRYGISDPEPRSNVMPVEPVGRSAAIYDPRQSRSYLLPVVFRWISQRHHVEVCLMMAVQFHEVDQETVRIPKADAYLTHLSSAMDCRSMCEIKKPRCEPYSDQAAQKNGVEPKWPRVTPSIRRWWAFRLFSSDRAHMT
jgi:hypothetical protein